MNSDRGDPLTMSVVICAHTKDRWHETTAAVASVRDQSVAAEDIVIVVDHNRELHEELAAALPDVTVVENRKEQGLSGARNTGVEVSSGEIIAFLDDDAVARSDWLQELRNGFISDAIAGVGGTTLPDWETGRPRWFPEEFDWVVGCTYRGREPGRVRNLLGGNASFRREVFTETAGFPAAIGRTSADRRPLGAEETELCIRAGQLRPDWEFLFVPDAVIWHHVPAARERLSYFRSRCYAEGLSKAAVTRSVGLTDALATESSYTVHTLGRGVLRGIGEALRGDLGGLQRSCAILLGLFATTLGFAVGIIGSSSWPFGRQNQPARSDEDGSRSDPDVSRGRGEPGGGHVAAVGKP